MRISPALVCLVLLTSCGGGGGGVSEPTEEGPLVPTPPADPLVVARRILEGCLQPDVERLLDLFADLEATLASGGATPQPTISLGAVNLLSNAVAVEVDLDVDGVNDLAATIRLAQGNGQPALSALAFAALAAQVTAQDFESVLAGLPDGTHALVEFETLLPPMTTGVVDFLVAGGTIAQASGLAEVASMDCRSTFSFDDVPASAILNGGTYPTMLVDYVLVDPEGTVTGTIDLDGTNLAAVTAHYLGTVSEYTLDLASGVLTPVVP